MTPLSAWTPAAQVARRQGNADLRSAQPAAGGRTGRTPTPRMPPSRHGPQQRRWRAGKGTPTSRWGPAQPAAGGRAGPRPPGTPGTQTPRMARAERRSPTGIARERETSADDAAPRSGESHVFFMTGEGAQEYPTSRTAPPVGGRRPHPLTATATGRSGPGRSAAALGAQRDPCPRSRRQAPPGRRTARRSDPESTSVTG